MASIARIESTVAPAKALPASPKQRSLFAVTAARSQRLDGTPFPERVAPSVELPDDLAALARGRDGLLEAALARLLSS